MQKKKVVAGHVRSRRLQAGPKEASAIPDEFIKTTGRKNGVDARLFLKWTISPNDRAF